MSKPFYRLFEYSAHGNYTLQINPASGVNREHLSYFKFIGRVECSRPGYRPPTLPHQRFLDASFVVSFHKMIMKSHTSRPRERGRWVASWVDMDTVSLIVIFRPLTRAVTRDRVIA